VINLKQKIRRGVSFNTHARLSDSNFSYRSYINADKVQKDVYCIFSDKVRSNVQYSMLVLLMGYANA